MRTKKLSPTLGMGYVIAGVCFLISPMLAVVDILPDFIGYALILKGIYCLSDMDEHISEAARLFRRLLILAIVRLGLVFFIYGMASDTEQPTLQLLCSFVLAILDCMAIIPAWRSLGNGLIYLGTRLEGKAVFDKRYPASHKRIYSNTKTLTERTFGYTVFFLVTREVLSTLPEFTVLTHQLGGADAGNRTMVYEFIGLMRGMCATLVVILGIIWLVKIIRYLVHLMQDRPFFEALRHKYETEVLTRPELFARRGVKLALVFLCVGLILTVDLFLDDVCVTPDFLFGIFSVISLLCLKKHVKGQAWTAALVGSVAYILLTAGEWVLQLGYFTLSDGVWAFRKAEIYALWMNMNYVRAITLLAGLLLMFLLVRVLIQAAKQYTGFSVTARDSVRPNERVAEVHRDLTHRLWIGFGLFAAASVASMVYMLTLPLAHDSLWEAWGFVDVVITGIFAAFFIHTVTVIFEQIDYKYLLS